MIEKFLEEFFVQGKSQETITQYRIALRDFGEFFDKQIEQAAKEDILSWQKELMEDNLPSTISWKIAALKSFFKWLQGEKSIAKGVRLPKISPPLKYYLLPDELRQVLDNPYNESWNKEVNAITRLRDLTILSTLAFTGVRIAELISLDQQNINFERKMLSVKGKGNKPRIIPLDLAGRELIDKLSSYLEAVSGYSASNGNPLFISLKSHERLSKSYIRYLVENTCKQLGIKKHISPHCLRHTFGFMCADNGVDIKACKELMGHSHISTTEIYYHLTTEQIQRQYKGVFKL